LPHRSLGLSKASPSGEKRVKGTTGDGLDPDNPESLNHVRRFLLEVEETKERG
jgi:hypothetical protein